MQLQSDSCPMEPMVMFYTIYLHIATVGITIQTVSSFLRNMSAVGNAAKLGTANSNIQTAQCCPSLNIIVGIEPTMH